MHAATHACMFKYCSSFLLNSSLTDILARKTQILEELGSCNFHSIINLYFNLQINYNLPSYLVTHTHTTMSKLVGPS
jgi:hypothetical protein